MQLHIPSKIWQEINAFAVLSSPNEITSLGTIENIDGKFRVKQIFIPRQLVNPGYCETTEGALNEIVSDLLENNAADIANLRFRWHSHADGSVFWSATDERDISSWEGPWVVNLVVNTNGDYLARLDISQGLEVVNIPLSVRIDIEDFPRELLEHCTSEIDQKVRPTQIRSPLANRDLKPNTIAFYQKVVEEFNTETFDFNQEPTKGGEKNEA